MDSKYNNLRKHLAEDQSPVPPGLEWAQMEAGIRQKMAKIQQEETAERKRKRRPLLLLLLLPLVGLGIWHSTVQEVISPSLVPSTKVAVSELATDQQYTNNKVSTKEETVDSATTNNPKAVFQNNQQQPLSTISSPSTKKQTTEVLEIAVSPAPNESETISSATRTPPTDTGIEQTSAFPLNGQNSSISLLPTLAAALQFSRPADLPQTIANEVPLSSKKPTVPAQLLASSGLTNWSMSYAENKPARQAFETPEYAYNASFAYLHSLKHNYQLYFGLQYQALTHRFEWEAHLTNQYIDLIDTVIQIQVNALTGQALNVRGNAQQEVSGTRRVRHYNQTRLLQLPIGLGKTWALGVWQAGILTGVNVNLWAQQKGRTLQNEQLIDYSGTSNDFSRQQWGMAGWAGAHVSYQVSARIGIAAQFQWQKSITNWSKETAVKLHPSILNIGLGLRYSLNQ